VIILDNGGATVYKRNVFGDLRSTCVICGINSRKDTAYCSFIERRSSTFAQLPALGQRQDWLLFLLKRCVIRTASSLRPLSSPASVRRELRTPIDILPYHQLIAPFGRRRDLSQFSRWTQNSVASALLCHVWRGVFRHGLCDGAKPAQAVRFRTGPHNPRERSTSLWM
jgi:hypothetical protein